MKLGFKSFVNGKVLAHEKVTRQLPFVFFLVFLALILITNRNWSEKTIRKIESVQDSIKELRAESVTHETRLMRINRPSEIAKRVKERGIDLIEPKEPATKIIVEKEED